MRLVHIAGGAAAVPLALLGADAELAGDVQAQLCRAGLLEPPVDRLFGPVSHWALAEFLQHWGLAGADQVDLPVASALLQADAAFAMVPGQDFAGDVVRAMEAAGHWVCRHPKALNIVYVEDMGLDGSPIADAQAPFKDARLLLRVGEGGRPEIAGAWECSIGPGRCGAQDLAAGHSGAMRIAQGQFKAWSVGLYQNGPPYEALVQTDKLAVRRDHRIAGDLVYTGMFGIAQHWAGEGAAGDGGPGGAAGLVGRTRSGHREFMAMVRSDPRYAASRSYRFLTTILPAQAVFAARR